MRQKLPSQKRYLDSQMKISKVTKAVKLNCLKAKLEVKKFLLTAKAIENKILKKARKKKLIYLRLWKKK